MWYFIEVVAVFGVAVLTGLPLAVFVRGFASLRLRKLNMSTSITHEIGVALLIMYCAGLATITVACNPQILTLDISVWKVNFIPFKFIYDLFVGCYNGYPINWIINLIGNIALFIPIGFLVSLLWKGDGWRKAMLISAASSLLIELCQLPQSNRATDIDDLILNTAGGLIGYMLFRLIKVENVSRFRVTQNKMYSDVQE